MPITLNPLDTCYNNEPCRFVDAIKDTKKLDEQVKKKQIIKERIQKYIAKY